jgi:hypothetical protein
MAFEFRSPVKFEARLRQVGRCAVCGEDLDDSDEEAHHVAPRQSGKPRDLGHAWLRTSDNCVVICGLCHGAVHQGSKFRFGAVAPPSYFRFSHGGDRTAHRLWADELERKISRLWQPS